MTALTPPDRAKLVGVLGMLGSEHVGERASAALLASRMVRDRGITWADLIDQPETFRRREDGATGWRADLALAQRHISFLRSWEQGFVHSIAAQRFSSTKQKVVLREIASALQARGME